MSDILKGLAILVGGYLLDKALDKDYNIKAEAFGVSLSFSTNDSYSSDDSDDYRKRISGR